MTTATDTPPTTEPPAPPPPAQETADDWKAKYEETLKEARKHEDRAKLNASAARELEALKARSMTDQEKAVEAAKAEARTETLREVGGKLAEAAIRVAAAGRPVDVDALLEGVDAAKFLDTHGDPDVKAITAWMNKVAPVSDAAHRKPNVVPNEGRTTPKPGQDDVREFARNLFGSADS